MPRDTHATGSSHETLWTKYEMLILQK